MGFIGGLAGFSQNQIKRARAAVAGVGVPDGGDPISIRRCGEPIGDGGPDNASARRRQPGIVDSSLAGDKQDDTITPADGGIQPSV
jgi:hypothetical protein